MIKEGWRRCSGEKTKTACYAKQDLCGSALSSRFIVRQCRDNGETMPALRRLPGGTENGFSLSFSLSYSLFVQFSSSRTSRKDARRKNGRNNGFIISGLYRRAGCHCSTSFLAVLLAVRRPPTVELGWNEPKLFRAAPFVAAPLIDTSQEAFFSSLSLGH